MDLAIGFKEDGLPHEKTTQADPRLCSKIHVVRTRYTYGTGGLLS